jgi:hypothetical protein
MEMAHSAEGVGTVAVGLTAAKTLVPKARQVQRAPARWPATQKRTERRDERPFIS